MLSILSLKFRKKEKKNGKMFQNVKEISTGNAILFIGVNGHHFFYVLKGSNVSIHVYTETVFDSHARIINKMFGLVRSRGQRAEVVAIATFSGDSLKNIQR